MSFFLLWHEHFYYDRLPPQSCGKVMFSVVSLSQLFCQCVSSQEVIMWSPMDMFKPVHSGTLTSHSPHPTQPWILPILTQTPSNGKPSCYFWLFKRPANSIEYTTVSHFSFKLLQVLRDKTAISHEIYPKDWKVSYVKMFRQGRFQKRVQSLARK